MQEDPKDPPRPGPCLGEPAIAATAPVAVVEPVGGGVVHLHLVTGEIQELDLATRRLSPPRRGPAQDPMVVPGRRVGFRRRGGSILRYGSSLIGRAGLRWERGGEVHELGVPGDTGQFLGMSSGFLVTASAGRALVHALPGGEVLREIGSDEDQVLDGGVGEDGATLVLLREAGSKRRLEWWDLASQEPTGSSQDVPLDACLQAGPDAQGRVVLRLEQGEASHLQRYGPCGGGALVPDPSPTRTGATELAPEGDALLRVCVGQGRGQRLYRIDLEDGEAQELDLPDLGEACVHQVAWAADGSVRVLTTEFSPDGSARVTLRRHGAPEVLVDHRAQGFPTLRWEDGALWILEPCAEHLETRRLWPASDEEPRRFLDDPTGRGHQFVLGVPGGFLVKHDRSGYRFLPAGDAPEWQVPGPYPRWVESADVSPDGRRVAAVLWPAELVIWDDPAAPPTRLPLEAMVMEVRWAPDGERLLLVRPYDAVLARPGEAGEVHDLGEAAFSYELEAEAGGEGFCMGGPWPRVWVPGEGIRERVGPPCWRWGCLEDGSELAAGWMTLWHTRGGALDPAWPDQARPGAMWLAADSAGRRLAWLTEAGRVELVEVATGRTEAVLSGGLLRSGAVSFDAEEDALWVVDFYHGLRRFDLGDTEGPGEAVTDLRFLIGLAPHPVGGVLAMGLDKLFHVRRGWWGWNVVELHACPPERLPAALGPDGALWIREEGRLFRCPPEAPGEVGAHAGWEVPEEQVLAVAPGADVRGLEGAMGTALRWWTPGGTTPLENPHLAPITAATFDRAGRLYTGAADGTLVVWDGTPES